MSGAGNRPIAIALRLYRALARMFPFEFKSIYGDELVQVTEEAAEQIWRYYGVLGLTSLLFDVAIRVPAEYAAELRRDLGYGLRMLAASPGFTSVALISLALGICIATSAYSELHGLILRNIAGVANPDRLVALQAPTSYPNYKRYRDRNDLFSSAFAYVAPVPFGISTGVRTERTWGQLVTPSYFSTLGVQPALGRFFDRAEEQPRQTPTVVVSYRFWEDHLQSDPLAAGKQLRINGYLCTLIGVGPKDFAGASPVLFGADVWLPPSVGAGIAPELADNALNRRDLTMFHVVARLKPGVAQDRAEAALNATAQEMEQDYGDANRNRKERRVLLMPGGRVLPVRRQDLPFYTEFFAVLGGMVLLIACANVANMMLARATERRREIAIRLSLGAGRSRLIRQLLTESMLIACAAGVVGFCCSMWLMRGASQLRLPYPMPVTFDLNPDWRALLFTLVITAFTGLAFGLAPAWQATRSDVALSLRESGNVRRYPFRRLNLRNLLMLSQIAGSLALLLLTGLLTLGSQTTLRVAAGFDPANLYLISLDPIRDGFTAEQTTAFFRRLLERLNQSPEVKAVCLTDTVPLQVNGNTGVRFSASAGISKSTYTAQKYIVGRNYFQTTGIAILSGRDFRKEDERGNAIGVIVSEALVNAYWRGEEAVGRRIEISNDEATPAYGVAPGTLDYRAGVLAGGPQAFEVVGVAKDIAQGFGIEKPRPAIYLPLRPAEYAHPSLEGVTLIVRSMPGVDAVGIVRREISALDAHVTAFNGRSMLSQIGQTLFTARAAAWTYGVIGSFGLILAAIGLAGVTAYSVAQRTREIGIRMALGAQRADVLGLVMKEGAMLVTIGTAVGLALAWIGMRVLSTTLYTVARSAAVISYGPLLFFGSPLLLAALVMLACYVPVRRSISIEPATALRQE